MTRRGQVTTSEANGNASGARPRVYQCEGLAPGPIDGAWLARWRVAPLLPATARTLGISGGTLRLTVSSQSVNRDPPFTVFAGSSSMAAAQSSEKRASRLAACSPLTKIALWLTVVFAIASLIQVVAWILGLDFNVFHQSKGARGLLLLVAIGTLLTLMAADRRPAADYGLLVGRNWRRLLFGGFAFGAIAYGSYCILCLRLDGYALWTNSLTPSRCARSSRASGKACVRISRKPRSPRCMPAMAVM